MRSTTDTKDNPAARWASESHHQPAANNLLVGYSDCISEPDSIKQQQPQSQALGQQQQQYSESQQVATRSTLDSCSSDRNQQQHDEMATTAGWPTDSDANSCKQMPIEAQLDSSSNGSTSDPPRGPQEANGADNDNKLLSGENDAGCTKDDKQDQLAQLISSTIGDIMLEFTPSKVTTN